MIRDSSFRLRAAIAILFIALCASILAIEIAYAPVKWAKVFIEFAALALACLSFLYLAGKLGADTGGAGENINLSKKLLYVILKGSPAAILFIKNRKAIWASRSIEDVLGWPVEKWLSEPNTEFCYPSKEEFERVEHDVIYKDIAMKGRAAYEYDYVHKDGHRVSTLVRMQALDKDNLDEGFIFSIIDNTERKKAEEVIKKLNEGLEQKIKERTKELAEKISELERFKDATVNRELRMKELRDEIAVLKEKLEGKPA